LLCLCGSNASKAQEQRTLLADAPRPHPGIIVGTVVDVQNDPIPGATVTLEGPGATFHCGVGGRMAGVAVIGQPNIAARRLDNPIEVPGALSFLAYGTFQSYVHGLEEYPEDVWPDNIELLYYSFHLMITLGTIFILLMAYASFQNWRGQLQSSTGCSGC